jgi:hypothetical protein
MLFVTTLACLCAALFHASPILALAFVPIIAAALAGTFRLLSTDDEKRGLAARRGLFATFCQSLDIVLWLILVLLGTLAAATLAGLLFVLPATARAAAPLVPAVRKTARGISRLLLATWQRIQPTIVQLSLSTTLRWAHAKAVTATIRLASTGRRLWRTYWLPTRSSMKAS